MNRGGHLQRLAAAAVLLLSGSGCGLPAEDRARTLDPNAAPYRVVTRERPSPPAGSYRVALYLVRDGALVSVPRRIPRPPDPESVLAALVAGPTEQEQEAGLSTVLPPGTEASARREGDVLTVSLRSAGEDNTRVDAPLGFGQLVLTLTALPGLRTVQFERDGTPLQVPRADGSLATGPLSRTDYLELLPS